MKIMNKSLILLLSSIVLLMADVACNKANKFEKEEQAEIDAYLERNSTLNFERKTSGLYYLELVKGTGRIPVKSDTACIKYTGKFLDGRIFDSNVGSTKTLDIVVGTSGLIVGFAEGITYMAEGGKSLLLVPSALGYGTTGSYGGGISGFTPLLFEVTLVKVKAGPGK
jgi:FKBP-type peptidyl-prolyl cis-trans isomerase FkpA